MKVETAITQTLRESLAPVHLEVENESGKHSVPPGSETHFRVLVVSSAFDGLGRVERHRKVNELLADQFRRGLHALSLRAVTPAEWQAQSTLHESPPCLGGSKPS